MRLVDAAGALVVATLELFNERNRCFVVDILIHLQKRVLRSTLARRPARGDEGQRERAGLTTSSSLADVDD